MNVFLAGLLLLAAATAPAFPFRTYADAGKLITEPPTYACSNGGERLALGDEWVIFTWQDRDLFIHYTDSKPDYIYLTVGDSKSGVIRVKAVLTIDEAKQRFPGPCAYGDEKET